MSDMDLKHYASSELTLNREKEYEQRVSMKPEGFWVSIENNDDGWASWCEANCYGIEHLIYSHQVAISDSPNILVLSSAVDIDDFAKAYGVSETKIDWSRLSRQYKGIIIAPYIWSRRMTSHTLWYYGWDCASGCIWDLSAIKSVNLIKEKA